MIAILCWLAIPVLIFALTTVGCTLVLWSDELPGPLGFGFGYTVAVTFFLGGFFACLYLLALGYRLWGQQ